MIHDRSYLIGCISYRIFSNETKKLYLCYLGPKQNQQDPLYEEGNNTTCACSKCPDQCNDFLCGKEQNIYWNQIFEFSLFKR